MPLLKIDQFSGTVPAKGDRALAPNFASVAKNTWLYSDELVGVHRRYALHSINNITRKVLRVPKGTVGGDPATPGVVPPPSYFGDDVWMQFTDPDTDFVRGPLVNDQYKRWYFCSPSLGLQFNTYSRMLAGFPPYKCGVIAPTANPTLSSVTGGTPPVVTRAYVCTYENEYGEESAPSPPTVGSGNGSGVWNITFPTYPTNPPVGYANYTKINLYRTITSDAGVATYFKVVTLPWGTASYGDDGSTNTDPMIAGNLQLESTNYQLPPANLMGIILMPNGFLIGWTSEAGSPTKPTSTLVMSEAYQLHAWPPEYAISSEYPIVGLGIMGSTCVVCTQSYPATLTGVKPVALSFTKSTTHEPCMSRGSIVSTPSGVYYASQNGLVGVTPAGFGNITAGLILRDEWVKTYKPQYIRACRFQNGYLAIRALPNPTDERSCFFLDPTAAKVALTEYTGFEFVQMVQNDPWSGEVFFIDIEKYPPDNNAVWQWDPPIPETMPVQWRSKEFQIADKRNFAAYAIYWDQDRYFTAEGDEDFIPFNVPVQFRVWCDRQLIYDASLSAADNGQGHRLPSGFKGDIWQFEVCARAPVYSLHVANTMKELRGG